MIEILKIDEVVIGSWLLRNDLIPSAWVEDKINSVNKLKSFKDSYFRCGDPNKFKIIL